MRRKAALILALIMLFTFAGCADMKDVNSRLYLTGIGVDRSEAKLRFTFQIAEPQGVSTAADNNNISYVNYVIDAQSLPEAQSKLEHRLSGELNMEHLICIIIGKTAAEGDCISIVESLFGDSSVRRRCAVACSDSPALSLLSLDTDGGSAIKAAELLENTGGSGKRGTVADLWELFSARESDGVYYLYKIGIVESVVSASDAQTMELSGAALYSSAGKVAELSAKQAELLPLLAGNANNLLINAGNGRSIELLSAEKRLDFRDDGGEISFVYAYELVCTDGGSGLDDAEIKSVAEAALSRELSKIVEICKSCGAYAPLGLEKEYRQRRYKKCSSLSTEQLADLLGGAEIKIKLNARAERADGYL